MAGRRHRWLRGAEQVESAHDGAHARAHGWFRVRADFTPSAKDTATVSTDGSWVYCEVTR